MWGDDELRRLVELLLMGAKTARQIADVRAVDRAEIYALAAQAEEMAATLEQICQRSASPSN